MNTIYNLNELGWNNDLENEFEQFSGDYSIGRIAVEYKNMYKVFCENGELIGVISGKMNYTATNRQDYPAVGDWVIIDKVNNNEDRTVIRGILKRKSKFSRKIAGSTFDEQIVATNIDVAFLCMSLNQNFNLRRLERYITMAWDSGATPVVLLTKSDLCEDLEEKLEQTREVAFGVDIHYISCINKNGLNEIRRYIKPGKTVAFFGSSGVGKSTIINELAGESKQDTMETSLLGDRGKHTTTNRELILLKDGGIVIDTPGMREIHILDVEESVDAAFEDIEELSKNCRFADCTHNLEPRCAVREAIESGALQQERFLNYLKLKREAEFMERKNSKKAELQYKKSIKKIANANYNNRKHR